MISAQKKAKWDLGLGNGGDGMLCYSSKDGQWSPLKRAGV